MKVVYAATRNLYHCLRTTIRSLFEYNDPEKVYLMLEDDEFPLKKEYMAMREFTYWLDSVINSKPSSDDWFDAF